MRDKQRPTNPHRLVDIFDFSKNYGSGEYFFGSSPELVAAALRRMADNVESGRLLINKIGCSTEIKQDEFLLMNWSIELCPRDYPEGAVAGENETK